MTNESSTTFRSARITDGINLHLRRTADFKAITLQVWISRVLDERAACASLLTSVLRQGCAKYPDRRAMGVEMEKMFGSTFGCSTGKVGGRQVSTMRLEMPDPQFLPGNPKLLERGFKFLREALLHPLTKGERFPAETVEREKRNLAARIHSLRNDKMVYAQRRCLEEMCRSESLRFYEHGDVETLAGITPESLYGFYREHIAAAPIDIFIVGNVALKDASALAKKYLSIKREAVAEIRPPAPVAALARPRKIEEEQEIEQAKLCLGLRTGATFGAARFAAATVFNGILGGFSHSRLFRKIREEAGLAYQVDSALEGSHGLMMISMGIEASNFRRALTITKAQIKRISEGDITPEEMHKTRRRIVSNLTGMRDSPARLMSFFFNRATNAVPPDLDKWIRRISAVRPAEVRAIARGTALDTVFFLRPVKSKAKK